jgi:hypothetical protein
LGRTLLGKERAMALREDDAWFWGAEPPTNRDEKGGSLG